MNAGRQTPRRARFYWERLLNEEGGWVHGPPPGQDLSSMRSGLGRDAGSVPGMWPHYSALNEKGELTPALRAEHAALCLFGLHQQSQATPMHRTGVGLGQALHHLRASGRFSEDAVDRRFAQAATASDIDEVAYHLRGLIGQLKTLKPAQALDYTRLMRDLRAWQDPELIGGIRRRWGSEYFRTTGPTEADSTPSEQRGEAAGKA